MCTLLRPVEFNNSKERMHSHHSGLVGEKKAKEKKRRKLAIHQPLSHAIVSPKGTGLNTQG